MVHPPPRNVSAPSVSSTSVARSQATAAPTTNYRLRSRRFRTSTRTIMEQTSIKLVTRCRSTVLSSCVLSTAPRRALSVSTRNGGKGRHATGARAVSDNEPSTSNLPEQLAERVLANETGLNTCTCQHW